MKTIFLDILLGVSAFIHVATVVNLSPDPNQVIPFAIDGAVNAIKSAYKESSVKRFVLTSSTATLLPVSPEKRQDGLVITPDTWSEDAIELAWAPPPYTPEHSLPVYAVSKIEQERAIWKFYEENKNKRPDMVVNTGKLPVARYAYDRLGNKRKSFPI